MASINDRYCVDRYEASLVEILSNGDERPWSPYEPVDGHTVRAVSEPGVVPQGYISEIQAKEACALSGKRLCKPAEWRKACMGPEPTTYGYGEAQRARPLQRLRPQPGRRDLRQDERSRRPRPVELRAHERPAAQPAGRHARPDRVARRLHQRLRRLRHGRATFTSGPRPERHLPGRLLPGYALNGDGCSYRTVAHEFTYHDYSTGFRCCADVAP